MKSNGITGEGNRHVKYPSQLKQAKVGHNNEIMEHITTSKNLNNDNFNKQGQHLNHSSFYDIISQRGPQGPRI